MYRIDILVTVYGFVFSTWRVPLLTNVLRTLIYVIFLSYFTLSIIFTGSHVGTGIKPLKWTVPRQQTLYQVCVCKYSGSKPLCDGSHIHLPLKVLDRQEKCTREGNHEKNKLPAACRLCTSCGWVPDFWVTVKVVLAGMCTSNSGTKFSIIIGTCADYKTYMYHTTWNISTYVCWYICKPRRCLLLVWRYVSMASVCMT